MGTLLLHVDGAAQVPGLVDAAIQLARAHGSHVVGLATTGNASFESSLGAGLLSRRDLMGAVDAARELAQQRARDFDTVAGHAGLRSHEVIVDDRDASEALAARSLYCDLVIVGQPDPARPNPTWPAAEFDRALRTCASPILVLPAAARSGAPLGRRVMVAWAAERACAHAVAAALPMLRRAEQVQVVHVDSPLSDVVAVPPEDELERVRERLVRDGVAASSWRRAGSYDLVGRLLEDIDSTGADLVVMGAWGRPRWSERVFGGVTRSMLDAMPVPVLFAH
ncbi:MAG TPA: universal stress protein [Burkholderiaceae bacterium]|nr:universal stress protein [Burkholderiaceae bacterium]